jgi:transcriptional regulator with XRE-family HTH domain
MATKKSGRGIALSRDSLLQARKVKHNMTQEDLAAALRIDVREIQRAEAEQHIDQDFAHRIAAILGVDLADLVKKGPVASTDTPPQKEESPAPATSQKAITITRYADGRVTVEMVFDKFLSPPFEKPALDLARAIAMFVGFQDDFGDDDVKVAAGSLRITVPLSRRDTALLMNAFVAGKLKQFEVISIKVAEEPRLDRWTSYEVSYHHREWPHLAGKFFNFRGKFILNAETLPNTEVIVDGRLIRSDDKGYFNITIELPMEREHIDLRIPDQGITVVVRRNFLNQFISPEDFPKTDDASKTQRKPHKLP